MSEGTSICMIINYSNKSSKNFTILLRAINLNLQEKDIKNHLMTIC